jgi:hypothetical protein
VTKLLPFAPSARRAPSRRLDVSCKIETPTGWTELNDGRRYVLEATSFGERSVSWRRTEVSSTFVEGTFPVSAVRENITETLAVWVLGSDRLEHTLARRRLTEALEQLAWRLMLRVEDVSTFWSCFASDYTVSAARELTHARRALVTAKVARLPGEETVLATGDEV